MAGHDKKRYCLQNLKYNICCVVAANGGSIHDQKQHAQKIWQSLDMWFLKHVSKQTNEQKHANRNTLQSKNPRKT